MCLSARLHAMRRVIFYSRIFSRGFLDWRVTAFKKRKSVLDLSHSKKLSAMLFPYFLKRFIKQGTLRLITADGREHVMGAGSPSVTARLHRRILNWTLALWPDVKIGEAYMDGSLTIEQGTLGDFIALFFINFHLSKDQPFFRWLEYISGRAAMLRQFNPATRSRKNVAYHYDLPDELYDMFLDEDRQYSCAYFTDPHNSLEQAQRDKKIHIASKLLLNKPGLSVLDIGSGWGGMGLYLARETGCNVTGVTLSTRQYKTSRERAQAAGLAEKCRFELRDYRQEAGPYDRIVSVGMFEHVGKKNYDEFFTQIRRLLAEDGVCLLHTISFSGEPAQTNGFIRKHIFPGADIPSLSEILEPIQRSGLYVTDIEILRLHYAETLQKWWERFSAQRAKVVALYGEVFYRKWEFYLIGCQMGFRYYGMMVAQIQLSKKLETVPITRDYMHEWEQEHQMISYARQARSSGEK